MEENIIYSKKWFEEVERSELPDYLTIAWRHFIKVEVEIENRSQNRVDADEVEKHKCISKISQ